MMESKLSKADKGRYFKYPKIPVAELTNVPIDPNSWVEIFEKVDGGNCQIRKIDGKMLHGSRGHFITGKSMNRVDWFKNFSKWFYSNSTLYNLPEDFAVIGEWPGSKIHTIEYDDKHKHKFYLLDVFDWNTLRFMNYKDGIGLIKRHGIEGVRYLKPVFSGRIGAANLTKLINRPSEFYDGPKEGVVIKSYGSDPQRFFKVYHPEFAESKEEKSGKMDHLTRIRFRKAYNWILEEYGREALNLNNVVNTVVKNISEECSEIYNPADVKKRLWSYIMFGELPSSWKELLVKK